MYLHHLAGVAGTAPGLYFGGWSFVQCYMTCLAEITNPCNQLRGLLTEFDEREGKLWTFNGVAWGFIFFWFRTVFFSYMMFTKTMVCLDGFVCPDYMSGLEGIDLVLMRFQ